MRYCLKTNIFSFPLVVSAPRRRLCSSGPNNQTRCCVSFTQLVGLFDEVDDDHDGHLHYTEFLAATLETDGKKVADERLAEAFDQLDMDDSGHISRDNLMEFLGRDSKVRREKNTRG